MSEIGMELLERYLAGEASAEECRRVEAWLVENPRRWAELTAVRDALEKAELSDRAVHEAVTEVWARLSAEIGALDKAPPRMVGRIGQEARVFTLGERAPRPLVALVAAVVVLIIGGWLASTLLLRRPGQAEEMRVVTTARGERADLRLPDGTQVMLGVASVLRFPVALGKSSREVSLEGEAYFDVVHDAGRPFVVLAGGLVAKDLGTQFTVRAYPEDAGARVVVREGSVAIRAAAVNAPERVVAPGQLGRVRAGQEPTVEPADTADYFAWTQGKLVLDQIPLREALPQLGRWFNLEFRLAHSTLGDVPLSARLTTQPTTDALNNLAASLGMRQRQVGRTVTLYPADSTQ